MTSLARQAKFQNDERINAERGAAQLRTEIKTLEEEIAARAASPNPPAVPEPREDNEPSVRLARMQTMLHSYERLAIGNACAIQHPNCPEEGLPVSGAAARSERDAAIAAMQAELDVTYGQMPRSYPTLNTNILYRAVANPAPPPDHFFERITRIIDNMSGLLRTDKVERINAATYASESAGLKWPTHCNYGAQRIAAAYGVQLHLHRDTGANKMNAYLNAGAYDTETHEMVRITDAAEAARLAAEGYLVVASMLGFWTTDEAGRPVRGDGHVAVVTGLTPGAEPSIGNLEVYQAGKEVGRMTLSLGFTAGAVRTGRVELFVWKAKERE